MTRSLLLLLLPLLFTLGVGCSHRSETGEMSQPAAAASAGESTATDAVGPPAFPEDATLGEKLRITRTYLQCPGAVVAVYRDGKKIFDEALGVASLKTGEPMTRRHHFRTASLAKPFVAVVLLQLAEEGKVTLDDPVSKYVKGVPDGENITLRMLAQHTSGLNNYIAHPDVKKAFAEQPTRHWKQSELLAFAYGKGPYFEAEKGGWMYSNTNYILLGQVIEKVERDDLNSVIQRRICKPLGLENTFYSVDAAERPEPFARGYQMGDEQGPIYWRGEGTVPYDVTDASPSMWHAAGAMVSTLDDTRRFIKAAATGELVSDEMFKQQTDWRDTSRRVDYKHGLGLMKYKGMIGHTGYVPGYQAVAMYDPDRNLTVVVLANLYSSPNYEEPAGAMFYVIMRHLTGKSYAPPGWEGW